MTQTKKHIDDFFNSVVTNTLDLKDDELQSLIDKRTSGNLDRKSLQKSLTDEDRTNGFKTKGIILMTLIATGIITFLLTSHPTVSPIKSVDNVISNNNSTTVQGLVSENQAASKSFAAPTDSVGTAIISSPIPLVELSDAALLKLGVYRKSTDEVLCYQDFGSNKYLYEVRYTQKPFGVKATIIDKNEAQGINKIPSFMPLQMTNLSGVGNVATALVSGEAAMLDQISLVEFTRLKEIEKLMNDHPGDPSKILSSDDQALLQKVVALKSQIHAKPKQTIANPNSLIPIVVRNGVSSANENDGFILWYQPTPELLNIIKSDKRTVVTEVIKITNDIISGISVYPNPAHNGANLQFELKEQRSVRVDLQDITGRHISIISRSNDLSSGKHEIQIHTQDLSSGIYIVMITTNMGEQSIQRLVITK